MVLLFLAYNSFLNNLKQCVNRYHDPVVFDILPIVVLIFFEGFRSFKILLFSLSFLILVFDSLNKLSCVKRHTDLIQSESVDGHYHRWHQQNDVQQTSQVRQVVDVRIKDPVYLHSFIRLIKIPILDHLRVRGSSNRCLGVVREVIHSIRFVRFKLVVLQAEEFQELHFSLPVWIPGFHVSVLKLEDSGGKADVEIWDESRTFSAEMGPILPDFEQTLLISIDLVLIELMELLAELLIDTCLD